MDRPVKRVSDSLTTQVQLLSMANMNGANRLFGGQLMSWMDIVAGVTARRHAGCAVTTLKVDELTFLEPAHANDTLVINGRMLSVGRTSMRVGVETFVESLQGEHQLINKAVFTMVALDENERPTLVPLLEEE